MTGAGRIGWTVSGNRGREDRDRGSPVGPASEPTRVLLVENSVGEAELVREMLADGRDFEREWVRHSGSLSEALTELEKGAVDCVVLDLSLPDSRGLDTFRAVQQVRDDVPIVILTGLDDEELATIAVQEGAQDYLVKGRVDAHGMRRAIRNAAQRKRAEVELVHQALHDQLTGLPNRDLFRDHVRVALGRCGRGGQSVAVLFMDLDDFKAVNDTFGHEVGDRLLVEASTRIRELLRPGDVVARFGGDEFIALCQDLTDERDAITVAKRFAHGMAVPFEVEGHELSMGLSIGLAFAQSPNTTPDSLIRRADHAMYQAKQRGADYELFDGDLHIRATRATPTEAELRHALDGGELRVFYQPQFDLRSGGVIGFEALLRWQHTRLGLLAPNDFVPVAEEAGLMEAIGKWVLGEACLQLARWSGDARSASVLMCVNVSRSQLVDPALPTLASEAIARAGVDAHHLCLEVAETEAARNPARTVPALSELRAKNIRLALDDFGAGSSSLSALEQYPVDILKIDPALISTSPARDHSQRVLGAMVAAGKALGLTTVAERVEQASQLAPLRALGCDAGQGFYFAAPDTPERVESMLLKSGGAVV